MIGMTRAALTLALVLLLGSLATAEEATPYHVSLKVALGVPDRWDYVTYDGSSQRVYVSHGDGISVIDGRNGMHVGELKGMPGGTHGIAIVPSLHRGYTDDGRAGEAVSFDTQTLAVRKHIKADADADAVVFDPASGHVFVVNGDSGTLTVIDPAADAAVGTVQAGGKLEFAVADGSGALFVNGAERREVLRVDTRRNLVDARWPVADCESPHGLAMDVNTRRLFVSCVNQRLVVVDARGGAVVASLPIGRGTDAAAFDPVRKLVFSSNGRDGTLSIIRERSADDFVAVAELKTQVTARTMSLDPKSGRLYLAAAELDPNAPAPTPGVRRPPPILPGSLSVLFLDPR